MGVLGFTEFLLFFMKFKWGLLSFTEFLLDLIRSKWVFTEH